MGGRHQAHFSHEQAAKMEVLAVVVPAITAPSRGLQLAVLEHREATEAMAPTQPLHQHATAAAGVVPPLMAVVAQAFLGWAKVVPESWTTLAANLCTTAAAAEVAAMDLSELGAPAVEVMAQVLDWQR
jgi:hypothetical protein